MKILLILSFFFLSACASTTHKEGRKIASMLTVNLGDMQWSKAGGDKGRQNLGSFSITSVLPAKNNRYILELSLGENKSIELVDKEGLQVSFSLKEVESFINLYRTGYFVNLVCSGFVEQDPVTKEFDQKCTLAQFE